MDSPINEENAHFFLPNPQQSVMAGVRTQHANRQNAAKYSNAARSSSDNGKCF